MLKLFNSNQELRSSKLMTIEPVWYELRNAIFLGEFTHAANLLASDPDLLDLRNGIGETVLHFLAVENDLRGVEWLHRRGFSLNTKNSFGQPIIFEVAQLGYQELFLWLAKHGADLLAMDNENRNILEFLQEDGNSEKSDRIVQFLLANVPSLRQLSDGHNDQS
jgi:hypothetical protein